MYKIYHMRTIWPILFSCILLSGHFIVIFLSSYSFDNEDFNYNSYDVIYDILVFFCFFFFFFNNSCIYIYVNHS